jgi:hypothetical protein
MWNFGTVVPAILSASDYISSGPWRSSYRESSQALDLIVHTYVVMICKLPGIAWMCWLEKKLQQRLHSAL